jgi:hypothetical protein
MAYADGFVLPKPGIPKILGILNILFGVLGTLFGLGMIASMLLIPLFFSFAEKAAKEEHATEEAKHKAQLKEVDNRAATAKTDEEKKAIDKEKATLIANTPTSPELDLDTISGGMRNPTILAHTYIFSGIGILINILRIVSGVGLIGLFAWGRSMALWLAAMTIVVLGISAATEILVIQPIKTEMLTKTMDKMEADLKTQGVPPNARASMKSATTMMAAMGLAWAVGAFFFFSIYPVTTLILLNTAGARAACLPKPG